VFYFQCVLTNVYIIRSIEKVLTTFERNIIFSEPFLIDVIGIHFRVYVFLHHAHRYSANLMVISTQGNIYFKGLDIGMSGAILTKLGQNF
jgi:hypothetical protein